MLADPRTLGCEGVTAKSRRAWRAKLRMLYVDYTFAVTAYAVTKAATREAAVFVVDDAAPTEEPRSRKRTAVAAWSGVGGRRRRW